MVGDRDGIPLIDQSARQNGADFDVEAGNGQMMNLDGGMNVLSPLMSPTKMDFSVLSPDSLSSPQARKASALPTSRSSDDSRKAKIMSDLREAATEDDVDAVKRIIAEEPLAVGFCDSNKMTALHYACRYVNTEVVTTLLGAGADPNAKDNEGLQPLHYAAKYFNKDHFREDIQESEQEARVHTNYIITLLCDKNAEVNAQEHFYEQTPLHFAAMKGNSEGTAILLERGADCNIVDANGMSPLMTACLYGTVDIVQILFHRSDRNTVDKRRNTPLHFAVSSGHLEVIEVFFTQAREEALEMLVRVNNEEKTPLELAVENDHADAIQFIFKHKPPLALWRESERHLLHVAAGRGYLEVVKCLVEGAKVDVATETDDGVLPLHEAAKRNHVNVIEYLLEQNAAMLDMKDNRGMTALLVAAGSNALDAVKVLVEKDARVYTVDRQGRNVLYLAAKYDAVQVIHFVMEHLGKQDEKPLARRKGKEWSPAFSLRIKPRSNKQQTLNRADQSGNTPLHVACSNGYLNSVRALQKYGANLNPINEDEETPLHLASAAGRVDVVQQLLEWDDKLALAKDDSGFTPLHNAAARGHPEVASLLCNNGADVMARDQRDETPSQVACYAGHLSVLQILIQKGAPANENAEKNLPTLLHIAASEGHDAIVQFLLSSTNAKLASRDDQGRTPLDIAIEKKFQSVARELLKHPDWKDLMVSPGRTRLLTSARDTPMRRLIKTFPDIAKDVFDKCIDVREGATGDTYFDYDFRYLDDTWMVISMEGKELIHDEDPYNSHNSYDLLPNTRPYSRNTDMIYDNHPLRLLVSSDCEYLLTHPLVYGLLKHKWNTLGKYFYYFSLLMYCTFLLLFSVYVMTTSAPYNVFDGKSLKFIDIVNEDGACDLIEHRPSSLFVICGWGVLILVIAQLVKEFGQFLSRGLSYFSAENLLEILIYVSALLVVLDLDDCAQRTGIRQGWQWNLAAGSAFLQWMNLLMFVRKLPRFGIYVVMFVDIFKTFSRFFLIFALFVFAFSIAFFIILQNRPEFSTLSSSVLKTTVMMIGEFEYTGIFHGDADDHHERMYTNDIARPLFLFFAIVMTILLMNLLVGLAVDDIKSVQEKAVIKRLAMQVDLVLQIESMMSAKLLKRMAKGGMAEYRNRSDWWKRLRDRFGSAETQETVEETTVVIRDPAVVESERRFAQQQSALDTLQSNVDLLYKKQLQMAETMDTILNLLRAGQTDTESEPPGQLSAFSSRTNTLQ